jgi:hypothetical protein
VLKFDATTLNFFVLSRYIIRAPLGSEGWIIGVHSLEGVIGGHSWLGLFLISGGFWHVATQPFDALMRAFTWSGEAILGYSLGTLSQWLRFASFVVLFLELFFDRRRSFHWTLSNLDLGGRKFLKSTQSFDLQ